MQKTELLVFTVSDREIIAVFQYVLVMVVEVLGTFGDRILVVIIVIMVV